MNLIRKHPWIMNLWPPFLFAGISLKASPDFRHIQVKLKLRFWNANYVGTQYGGSLFSMTDPFYMVMLIENLGSKYTVWDKSARIHYLRPGKTDVTADFLLTEHDLKQIKTELEKESRIEWKRTIEIKDANGEIVAKVDKLISIKSDYSVRETKPKT